MSKDRALQLKPAQVNCSPAQSPFHSHFPGARDLTLLSREACKAYAEDTHRKDGELKEAYKIGADPDEWVAQTDEVVRASEKQRQEEEMEAQEHEDQLEDDEAADDETAAKGVSKKRAAPSKASASKAKKPRTSGAAKKDASGSSGKADSVGPRKSVPAGDDEGGDEVLDEDTRKVRTWRHSLQRAFLPKDRSPTEEDVKGQEAIFADVENFDVTQDHLKATKINKVMKKILQLESVPLDEIHHFKRRAEALVAKWTGSSAPAAATPPGDDTSAPAKKENGNGEGAASGEAAPATASAAPQESEAKAAPNGEDGAKEAAPSAPAQEGDADAGDLTALPDEQPKSEPVNGGETA